MSKEFIFGRNSAIEYLATGSDINKAFIQKNSNEGSMQKIHRALKDRQIPISYVEKNKLNEMTDNGNHQGIVLSIPSHEYSSVEDILKAAEKKNEDPFIILLDGIEDPHNLGAIIRTANIVGVHGVIIPKRRSASLTSIVDKTSAGALNFTPVARVSNLNDTINKLKQRGLWIISCDMSGQTMYEANLTGPIGIVIGNEGKGVSSLVNKNSDMTVSIPMKGEINSLNASVSCGVISYEIFRQRLMRKV